MKVLFDNNVPVPLRRHLTGHHVLTARQMNRHELENGDLLSASERAGFDLMLTGDKNISYQQNLAGRRISLIVLATTRWSVLRGHTDQVVEAVNRALPGSFEQLHR